MNAFALPVLLAGAAIAFGCRSSSPEEPPTCECAGGCSSEVIAEDVAAYPTLTEVQPRPAVRLRDREPQRGGPRESSAARTAHATHKVFFGNLHSHTGYSDGTGLPEEAFTHARDVADLDFLALTEHNHRQAASASLGVAFNPDRYEGPRQDALIPVANRMSQDGIFIALYGQEFSSISSGNHANVFDVPHVINDQAVVNGDFASLLDTWLPANLDTTGQPGLLQLNHPWNSDSSNSKEYGRDDYQSFAVWREKLDTRAELIEVINGPSHDEGTGRAPTTVSDSEYRRYLNMGFHLAPTANQDNHRRTWGSITDARTAVVTSTLTKANLLAALRSRHAYATLDRNLRIVATVEGRLCGEVMVPPSQGTQLEVEIWIHDEDDQGPYWVEVFTDRIDGSSGDVRAQLEAVYGPIDPSTGTGEPEVWTLPDLSYGGWDYAYFRVAQGDFGSRQQQAWLAPVWFE